MSLTGDIADTGESNLDDFEEAESPSNIKQECSSEDSHHPAEDGHASDGSERPGRYYGPDYNWMYHNRDERALATALEQDENDDLSIHLYNAHAWKREHRMPQIHPDIKPWQSKQRWIQLDDEGKPPFLPPALWCAWPLKPTDVPRSQERWGRSATAAEDSTGTYSNPEPWRPGLFLQENLKAICLRKAKEEFLKRTFEQPLPKSEGVFPKSRDKSKEQSARSSVDTDDVDDFTKLGNDIKQPECRKPMLTKPCQEPSPVFMGDDEKAGGILQPTVQHMLAKLDDLLVGLHHSRKGHRTEVPFTRGRNTSASRSKSRTRPQSSSAGPSSQKRKRVIAEDEEVEFQSTSASEEDIPQKKARKPRKPTESKHRNRLGQRDWSEVLGIAALVGWDQPVLNRTAKRCTATFGETMAMRIMPDTIGGQSRDRVVEYKPGPLPSLDLEEEDEEEDEDVDDITDPVYLCPFATCPRSREPFEKPWRFREHLKRAHKQTATDVEILEARIKGEVASSDDGDDDSEGTDDAEDTGEEDTRTVEASTQPNRLFHPITLQIHRSKDKRPRREASRTVEPAVKLETSD